MLLMRTLIPLSKYKKPYKSRLLKKISTAFTIPFRIIIAVLIWSEWRDAYRYAICTARRQAPSHLFAKNSHSGCFIYAKAIFHI